MFYHTMQYCILAADSQTVLLIYPLHCGMDGNAASVALPHGVLGRGPISKTIVPPLTISLCSNHGMFNGLPFSVADWMYLFTAETFLAVMVNTFPPASVSLTSSKIGLP